MKNRNFLQSQFIFWPHEEVKSNLSVLKKRLSMCLSYKETVPEIVYMGENGSPYHDLEETKPVNSFVLVGEDSDERLEKMKFHFEDSINDILMYFKKEREYLSKMFFQTFFTFENLNLTKRSIKKTKKSIKIRFKERVDESPPEIKEDMVLII